MMRRLELVTGKKQESIPSQQAFFLAPEQVNYSLDD